MLGEHPGGRCGRTTPKFPGPSPSFVTYRFKAYGKAEVWLGPPLVRMTNSLWTVQKKKIRRNYLEVIHCVFLHGMYWPLLHTPWRNQVSKGLNLCDSLKHRGTPSVALDLKPCFFNDNVIQEPYNREEHQVHHVPQLSNEPGRCS